MLNLTREDQLAWWRYMEANRKAARMYRELPISYYIAAEDTP